MDTLTQSAVSKLNCAVNVKKGCMLTAEETKALLESFNLLREETRVN